MSADKKNILINQFLEAAEKYAANTALEKGSQKVSYAELRSKAMAFAAALTDDDRPLAAVLAPKSITTYAGILGSLLASKGYVPLNPKFPVKRSLEMIRIAGVKSIIAGRECLNYLEQLLHELPAKEIRFILDENEDVQTLSTRFPGFDFRLATAAPGQSIVQVNSLEKDLVYLLFTSGSTGTPKAVPVNNLNVTSYLHHIRKNFAFFPEDRFSHTFDLTFDLSAHDMFVSWLSGGCLVIPETDSPFKLASYIREKEISVWFSVPSVAVMLEKIRKLKESNFPSLRLSFFCGEALTLSTAQNWQAAAPDSLLVNLYGPAEATIAITQYRFSESKSRQEMNGILSIGKVFEGQHYFITEDYRSDSTKGELCLSGSQVIHQYYKNEEMSRDRFFSLNNRYWYRTGDIVAKDDEGKLFFLGRADAEVKISGYRVNLHEIEKLISDFTGGEKIVVIYDKDEQKAAGNLVLFAGMEVEHNYDEEGIMDYCRNHLPWYMLPGRIVFIDEFPLNENGKTDRNRLKSMYL